MPARKKPECEDARHGGTVELETFDRRRSTS